MITKYIIALLMALTWTANVDASVRSEEKSSRVVETDTIDSEKELSDVVVTTRRAGITRMSGAELGSIINRDELFKAACCNLGESFTTNPSVDVTYSDAATGARQIKLLGLSGTYVQMLLENIPDLRGVAAPYALGYVPGPWMKSIQVSKGAASVKNGYESITGQINVEYKKPDDEQGAEVNLYGNSKGRIEANLDANVHLNEHLSTEILLHHENNLADHDSDGDGFMDMPQVEQTNIQNRWKLKQGRYLFHGGLTALKEYRHSGQMHSHSETEMGKYSIRINTERYSAYAKNAFIINPDNGTNIALMTSGSIHQADALYGLKGYRANQKNLYASLMFETNLAKLHNISLGLSFNHDYVGQDVRYNANEQYQAADEKETTPGAYVQYTYTLGSTLTAMAGLRIDHSSKYGTFLTPRFHLKYMPCDVVSIRISAGKGYRTVHALAENNFLLASGRQLLIDPLKQEEAWNYGLSTALNIPLLGHTLKLNAEYFYTHFVQQAIVDYDTDKSLIRITNLSGKSYSHTFQIDATYPLFQGMTMTAAWRLNQVKTTYGEILKEKPLTNRYKGLITASYKTPLGIWQFDATLQLNGGGRLPDPYTLSDGSLSWARRYHAYEQLSAQLTRWFPHFSVYIGGENLTNFKQRHPILGSDNPWSSDFEPTLVWGPVEGAVIYAGIRINIGRNSF